MEENSDGSPLFFNVEDFVSNCVTGDVYNHCPPNYGPAISARVGNESITCVVHDTHFDLDFRAVGNTQTIMGLRFEWLRKSNVTNHVDIPL